ncbi:MAG: hypothetical protein A2901_04365 [Elusimicrobia bacterium RIFCSPLOWO2_01_FULL_54_10]|nr:MAG: hypothetical protein A2901_04365 [Elusimicrobia bacterium RIFCSPLOWO2_01_FULL_54_10]
MNEFDRLWNMMDDLMEGLIDFDAFEREFDRQFAQMEQDFYREFVNTVRKTVELCHGIECCQPPEELHISLCRAIECTPQCAPTKKAKSGRHKPRKKP